MNIVEVALSQQGVQESELNNIIYNTWYYNRVVKGGSYPYCAVFVAWCAHRAGLSQKVIPRTASVKSLYNYYMSQGLFKEIGYIPQTGDLMIQRSNGASHIGIVLLADETNFYTIEGNTGKGVEICEHYYLENTLTGFATPHYPDKVVFDLSQFSATASGVNMTEEEIWDWFKTKGYDNCVTAGFMSVMSQLTQGYNPAYVEEKTQSFTLTSLGIFQWTWGEGTNTVESVEQGMQNYPNSDIAQYKNWCDSKGLQYESCINQLEFFWERVNDPNSSYHSLHPNNLNLQIDSSNPDVNQQRLDTADKAIGTLCNTCGYTLSSEDGTHDTAISMYVQYNERTNQSIAETTVNPNPDTPMRANAAIKKIINAGRYKYTDYVVKLSVTTGKVETLEEIADQFKITPQLIVFANNLNSWTLAIGQKLAIPTTANDTTYSLEEASSGTEGLKELKHTYKVSVSCPTVVVEFYGEYGKLAAKTTIGKTETNEHLDNEVISISTMRSLGNDCPTFSLSLVWRNKWYDNIASNDLVIIKMQRPPEELQPVMFGLVDDIRKTLDFSNTQPQRAVRISGRGVNKAFCLFNIGLLEKYSTADMGTGFFTTLFDIAKGGSAAAMKIAVDAYLGKGLNYRFGDSYTESSLQSLKDIMKFQWEVYPGEWIINAASFTSFSGSLWNFLKELENAPFNETYWEVLNGKPTLVHRPTPFHKEKWVNLPRILIKDYDIVNNETGRGDTETYTVFQVDVALMGGETKTAFPPLWYPPFYAKYGLRLMSAPTIYKIVDNENSEFEPRKFTTDLFDFYIKNNVMENGTIMVKGSNQYRIGERIILESENMEYYVEGVSHTFNMYSAWTTALSVTRGIQPELRFTPPYGAGEDLTPDIMIALIKLTGSGTIDWSNLKDSQYAIDEHGNYIVSNSTEGGSSGGGTFGSNWYSYNGKYFTHPSPNCMYITSPFGARSAPTEGASSYHYGVDLANDTGVTEGQPIVAACDGTVVYAGEASGYGNYIEIDHGDGTSTRYAHMFSSDLLVREGDTVTAGQQIARVGSAGIGTGAHLHFELRQNGTPIDPQSNLFNNPTSRPLSANSGDYSQSLANASFNQVAETCYSYLRNVKGLSKGQACALLGNLQQESAFDIDITNSIGAYGLCQWLGDRYYNLVNYCRDGGYELTSVEGQLGFLFQELESSERISLGVLQDIPDSRDGATQGAVSFGEAFERYGDGEEGSRSIYAGQWYDYF